MTRKNGCNKQYKDISHIQIQIGKKSTKIDFCFVCVEQRNFYGSIFGSPTTGILTTNNGDKMGDMGSMHKVLEFKFMIVAFS